MSGPPPPRAVTVSFANDFMRADFNGRTCAVITDQAHHVFPFVKAVQEIRGVFKFFFIFLSTQPVASTSPTTLQVGDCQVEKTATSQQSTRVPRS